jgi:hypothetical protein
VRVRGCRPHSAQPRLHRPLRSRPHSSPSAPPLSPCPGYGARRLDQRLPQQPKP